MKIFMSILRVIATVALFASLTTMFYIFYLIGVEYMALLLASISCVMFAIYLLFDMQKDEKER